jgi:hypothetical protein
MGFDNVFILDEKGYENNKNNFKKLKYVIKNNCWICISHGKGDSYTLVNRNGIRQYTHRYVYELYNSTIPENMVIMHTCDNPACINPNHLKIGTSKDNSLDMANKGRSTKGRKMPDKAKEKLSNINKKFSDKQLLEIKRLIINKEKVKDIALKFNCHYATISAIKNGKSKAYSKELGGGIKEWIIEGKDN